MASRRCPECDEPLSGRRKLCPECMRTEVNARQRERDRAARERGAGTDYGVESTELGEQLVVDMTLGGRPPAFAGIARTPIEPRPEPEISDGRVASPAERWAAAHHRDMTGVPASVRRDRARLDSVLAHQRFGPQDELPELTSWESLQAASERVDNGVSFPAPNLAPAARLDHLGRPYPRARGNRGRNGLWR